MAGFTDLSKTFYELQDTWSKVRGDVFSHLLAGGVIFGLLGVSFPTVQLPTINPTAVIEDPYFKFLKETGFVFVLPLVPVATLLVYGLLLRAVGRWLVSFQLLFFPPRIEPWVTSYAVADSAIETIARTLDDPEFSIADLSRRLNDLTLKYQATRKDEFKSFTDSLQQVSQNTSVYLGNGSVFLFVWVSLFLFLPDTNGWRQQNVSHFMPVVLFLAGFIAWARLRLGRMMRYFPQFQMTFVAQMVRTDPELQPLIEESRQKEPDLRRRVVQLRQEERHARKTPSLRSFAAARLGWKWLGQRRQHWRMRRHGWPLIDLYERGERFAWDAEENEQFEDTWLKGYVAYLYYRIHLGTRRTLRLIGRMFIYFLTGAP